MTPRLHCLVRTEIHNRQALVQGPASARNGVKGSVSAVCLAELQESGA